MNPFQQTMRHTLFALLTLGCVATPAVGQGNALVLNGATSYATASDNSSLRLGVGATQSFTIELSFYLSPVKPSGYHLLVLKDRAYEVGIEFQTNYSQTWIHFDLWRSTNNFDRDTARTFVGALKPGRHHLAVVFKNTPTQDLRVVFLDGFVAGRVEFGSFPSGIAASTTPLCIGGVGGTNSFPGFIDEARFSESIRYTNENYSGFNVPYRVPVSPFTADTNTVALWHFDEPPGATTFLDTSGHGNHLTATNGATTAEPPRVLNAGALDLGFHPGLGVEHEASPNGVLALGLQTNGQIVIGGQFLRVDGLSRSNLARLNPDGSVDPSFDVRLTGGFRADVRAIIPLPNNQILIGGDFSTVNGINRPALARLNQDGSLDPTFAPVFGGSSDTVDTMVRQPDGKILIGGRFSSVGGLTRHKVARLNANGTPDATFDSGFNLFFGVDRLLLQPDGRLVCLVDFYSFSLQLHTNVIRLNANGSWDTSFQPSLVNLIGRDSIALQPDGKILVTGYFTNVNGSPRVGAARLHTNGLLDATFNLANSLGTIHTNGGLLDFVAAQADGKILLGGAFYTAPSTVISSIARFLPNGALDPTFQPAEFYRPNNTVHDLKLLPDGKLLIAGEFTDVNGYSRSGIARLHGDIVLPPRFLSISRQPSGAIQLLLTNSSLRPVILQASSNLSSPQWSVVATNLIPSNRLDFLDTTAELFGSRSYRALLKEP